MKYQRHSGFLGKDIVKLIYNKNMRECKANNCDTIVRGFEWEEYCGYHYGCLSKLRKYTDISTEAKEIETFTTWFNGNCGYVITYDPYYSCPYFIWIVVYEPAVRSTRENLVAIKKKTHYSSLGGARNKATRIKNKLQNNDFHDTPMLKVHPEAKNWERFSNSITSPHIVKENFYHKITEPSRYFKTLDIAKVNEGSYDHVGIYIGNDSVCHFTKKYDGVRIHSWSDFLEKYHEGNGRITRYHSMIPFKHTRKIVKQIAWAVENKFREDKYCLPNRNCEHFANMIIYGINYSEQVNGNKFGSSFCFSCFICHDSNGNPTFSGNNDKGNTIKLTNEMSETDDRLGYTTNWRSNQMEERIEVPPKKDCRIM